MGAESEWRLRLVGRGVGLRQVCGEWLRQVGGEWRLRQVGKGVGLRQVGEGVGLSQVGGEWRLCQGEGLLL